MHFIQFQKATLARLAALAVAASAVAAPAYANGVGETGFAPLIPTSRTTIDTPAATLVDSGGLVVTRAANSTLQWTLGTGVVQQIPGNATTPNAPVLAVFNSTQAVVFYRSSDSKVFAQVFTDDGGTKGAWSKAVQVPNVVTPVPPAVHINGNKFFLVFTGANEQLFQTTSANVVTWTTPTAIPGNAITTSSPALALTLATPNAATGIESGKLVIFYRSPDSKMHFATETAAGAFSSFQVIPGDGLSASGPAAVGYGSANHLVDVAILDAKGAISWNELNATTGKWRSTGNSWAVATGANTTLSPPTLWHQVGGNVDAAVLLIRNNPTNQVFSKFLNNVASTAQSVEDFKRPMSSSAAGSSR